MLRNGDFEAGVEHWDLISDYDAERMIVHRDVLRDLGESITPHGGYYLAWVGGTPDGESPIELGRPGRFWATQMYQTITIPANITRLVMSGYRWITSEEQQSAEERDFADCLIETLMDEGEEQLFEAAPYFNNTQEEPRWVDFGDAAWPEDIAEMAGRTVNVFIGSHNDTMGITSFFFDDISVQVTCD